MDDGRIVHQHSRQNPYHCRSIELLPERTPFLFGWIPFDPVMGLFEKAGRRFEKLKQEATATARENADYECTECGKRVFTEQDQCPECGAEAVVPVESDESAREQEDDDPGTGDGRDSPSAEESSSSTDDDDLSAPTDDGTR